MERKWGLILDWGIGYNGREKRLTARKLQDFYKLGDALHFEMPERFFFVAALWCVYCFAVCLQVDEPKDHSGMIVRHCHF